MDSDSFWHTDALRFYVSGNLERVTRRVKVLINVQHIVSITGNSRDGLAEVKLADEQTFIVPMEFVKQKFGVVVGGMDKLERG